MTELQFSEGPSMTASLDQSVSGIDAHDDPATLASLVICRVRVAVGRKACGSL